MNKKYQIFISSTYEDLKSCRTSVRDAILSMMHFPVGMELFGAANEKQWDIIKETIDSSDYYVLIIGNRYGTLISECDKNSISYTEKEFDYASESGIPILAFIANENVLIGPTEIENDEKREKLKLFKEKIKNKYLIDFWSSEADLTQKVINSLYRQMDRTERPGWIRGGNAQNSLDTINYLSERVRELEAENKLLVEKNSDAIRMPSIRMQFEFVGSLFNYGTEKYNQDMSAVEITEHGWVIHAKKIEPSVERFDCKPLSMDDVPDELQEYVTEASINEYNKNIPSKEEYEEYNHLVNKYYNVKENGFIVKIVIVNEGTKKATDINADIMLPNGMIAMKKAEAVDMNMPPELSYPLNPIEEAKKYINNPQQYEGEKTFSEIITTLNKNGRRRHDSYTYDDDYDIWVKEHNIRAWEKSLIHTYECYPGECCIVPIEEGDYIIDTNLICEEIPESVNNKMRIKVVFDR